MVNRRNLLIAAAVVVVLLVGVGWYAVSRSTGGGTASTPTSGPPAGPSSTGRSASPSPSDSVSASPSDQNPSPSGSPSLPGVSTVNPDSLPKLPFDVVLPGTWNCTTDTLGLGGLAYECANSSDPAKVTNQLRLVWRSCPDDCPQARQNLLSVDWQVAWFGEIQRLAPQDKQTATIQTQGASGYFYALNRFTKFDDSQYQYAVVVQGPVADKTLLNAIAQSIRTNAG
jgi:hypothetical protein